MDILCPSLLLFKMEYIVLKNELLRNNDQQTTTEIDTYSLVIILENITCFFTMILFSLIKLLLLSTLA